MRTTAFRNSGRRQQAMRANRVLREITDVRLKGMRLSGQRVIGMLPNGMRPEGMRPNGMRPNGMRLKDTAQGNAA